MKKLLLAIFVVAFGVLGASRADAVVDAELRYWYSDLDSEVRSTTGGVLGTDINFVDDLGLDDQKGFVEGRITLEFGRHSLRYGYVPLQWSGTGVLSRNITFGGQTYTASTATDSEINVDYHRLGYRFDLFDMLSNRVGLIAEVKYFDADATVKAPSLGFDETESIQAPLPTVGVAAQVGLPFLINVSGEVTGITLGSDAYVFDAEAMVNFDPAPFITVSGGYRYFTFHLEKDDDKADIDLHGPFVTIKADF